MRLLNKFMYWLYGTQLTVKATWHLVTFILCIRSTQLKIIFLMACYVWSLCLFVRLFVYLFVHSFVWMWSFCSLIWNKHQKWRVYLLYQKYQYSHQFFYVYWKIWIYKHLGCLKSSMLLFLRIPIYDITMQTFQHTILIKYFKTSTYGPILGRNDEFKFQF